LTGKWENFEQLEEVLSLPELTAIANRLYDKENENKEFAAALQGVDLYGNGGGSGEMVDISQHHVGEESLDGIGIEIMEE
jgi:hypothetical protein